MRTWLGTASSVTSTEKWLSALQAGQCFGRFANLAAGAGVVNQVQLFNPVASGKTALVRTFVGSAANNAFINVALWDTALGTDVGAGFNLLDGGPAAACHIRTAQPAAITGSVFMEFLVIAATSFQPVVEWVAQLAGGQGIVVETRDQNLQLSCAYLWMEQ